MTNHWNDIKNSDVIMIIGSNAAENHPVAFRWVTEAMKNGAKLISVDPRFTRSSSKASIVDGIQLYSQMRSGTDIAFMMGMMKYAVDNNKINWNYVKSCTNASFLIDPNFGTCRDVSVIPGGTGTGTFSGLVPSGADHKQYEYVKTTWAYQFDDQETKLDLKVDLNLGDNTVWAAFVEQISAYDIDTVCSITGADSATLTKIYDVYTSTFEDAKSACIMYAMGSTQHTYGTQNVRSYAMMQLLLGNVGVAGGGINALRGESNVQGSTDMCLLWHILPGYLGVTTTAHTTREIYKATYSVGKAPQDPDPTTDPVSLSWWRFGGKYIDSLLQAWWPVETTGSLDTSYTYLPKAEAGKAYSHIDIFEAMHAGEIKGLMCWGQNPAVGGPSLGFERKALENLDWLVCVDLWETETAAFWKGPDASETVNTVVYLLPAAASYEKEGSVTNSGRWSQWRYKAAEPPGEALDDLQIINLLAKKLIDLYSPGGTPLANPVAKLHWGFYPGEDAHGVNGSSPNGYETDGHADPHKVAWEINGYWCPSSDKAGHRVDGFWGTGTYSTLQENGLTSSGNWLYCSHYPDDENRQEWMNNVDNSSSGIGLFSGWSYAWPLNRRIIYNGASVYQPGFVPDGKTVGDPLAPDKYVLKYIDNGATLVAGCDVPDGYKPPGLAGNRYPFIMQREGHAHLYGPGRADGPFPEHYEPWETPLTANPLGTNVLVSPTLHAHQRAWDVERAAPGEFPIVATTYRLTEHWQAGQMTRNNPWLCELMPAAFVELSQELADSKGIGNGDMVKITTKRTAAYGSYMTAVACVTKRFKPYNVAGGTLHHIGVIWHFGYTGCCTGDSGNLLTAHVGDANTGIPESKAFTCDIEKL